ncbi:hypothetical protein GGS23DRAFT_110481 [Durotheca rogersii]|uniref:uncharacterized protein n=1 Tax=Durotheca rogersii TaxID=419775 RepID=UPI002220A838|nr:uncharacterized protein GGS23DRAFT_110481 [Durotheca rogersii]KAI5862188.1 hypothetical protein GGS23DRAFT_110481 [Durotheca rogersii]
MQLPSLPLRPHHRLVIANLLRLLSLPPSSSLLFSPPLPLLLAFFLSPDPNSPSRSRLLPSLGFWIGEFPPRVSSAQRPPRPFYPVPPLASSTCPICALSGAPPSGSFLPLLSLKYTSETLPFLTLFCL